MKLSLLSARQLNTKKQLNTKQTEYHYLNLIYFYLTVVTMFETYEQIEACILEAVPVHKNQPDHLISILADEFDILYPCLYTQLNDYQL